MMNITKRGDLIVDQYGNYYYAIDQKDGMLKIVNAFMDLSYRRRLDDPYIEMHYGEPVGQHPYQLLKDHIDMILNGKSRFKILSLEEVEKHYTTIIDPLYFLE